MNDRIAVDTNAVVDLLRRDRSDPPRLRETQGVVVPLTVFGELLAGAYSSDQVRENVNAIEQYVASRELLSPDDFTARIYGRLRGRFGFLGQPKINDYWIAALCIQHQLPLLTNDRGFDAIQELTAIHW